MNGAYLLDKNILLWLDREPGRIPSEVMIQLDLAEQVYYSAASVWELAIKQSLGKISISAPVSLLAERAGLLELPVTTRYAEAAAQLPLHHRDPFDRMLVAQAMCERLVLITADRRLLAHGSLVLAI